MSEAITNPFDRKPSERTYAAIGWALMAVVAGIFVYLRFVPTDRAIAFRLVVTMLLLVNALYWRVADRRLARFVINPKLSAACRVALAGFIVIINIPVADMIARGRMPHYLVTLPSYYADAVVIWHLSLVVLISTISLARLVVVLIYRAVMWVRRQVRSDSATNIANRADNPSINSGDPLEAGVAIDVGRRRFLQTACVTLPAIALPSAVVASRRQEGALLTRRVQLPAPWLPERLRGLTITHVSDLHVGRHYRTWMLRKLVDVVGDFDSDLVLFSGDIVDVSNDMLPPAIHAIRQMPSRYGMYHCIGNHDQIDNRAEWVAAMREHFNLLIDERRSIDIGGERVTIAGLDFARRDLSELNVPSHAYHAREALLGHDPERDGPVIALAHHPHAFDALATQGVPLTLSGHTHGGQLMLTAPESHLEIGAGNLLFRYIRGFYRRPNATLFVNAGVGNWFPLRVNAPAEVVQIQLT
ncbi:MAG: metallophosphoesterase [Phycisphaerales bacterium]|nr:metallophosphoesterase [Phycisphaerales bacterium]